MNGSFIGKCLAIAAPSGCNNSINMCVHLAATLSEAHWRLRDLVSPHGDNTLYCIGAQVTWPLALISHTVLTRLLGAQFT